MQKTGYLRFHDIDCVFFEDDETIRLVPVNPGDFPRLSYHSRETFFPLKYSDDIDKNITTIIKCIQDNLDHSLVLYKQYGALLLNDNPISSMILTSPSIDCFYNPSSYYFDKKQLGIPNSADLIYGSETVDSWSLKIDDHDVDFELQYGKILTRGISSDLMLHPRIVVSFQPTSDVSFFYRVYRLIAQYLQFVLYDSTECHFRIELRNNEKGSNNQGWLINYETKSTDVRFALSSSGYRHFRPYQNAIISLFANDANLSLSHIPKDYRYRGSDHSTNSIVQLFSAFESEFERAKDRYLCHDPSTIARIKELTLTQLAALSNGSLCSEEKAFLEQAKQQIQRIGTQIGQRKKIMVVFSSFYEVLKSSTILFVNFVGEEPGEKEWKEFARHCADHIVDLRSKAAHTDMNITISDEEADYLHLLEIVLYCQMLRRAGIDDHGIEVLIGLVFHCNDVGWMEFMHKMKKTDAE